MVMAVSLLPVGALPTAAAATVGEGTAAPSFNESWGCGAPSTNSVYVERRGYLPGTEKLRGPRGDFFGRTIDEVRASLVYWTVPMSGGYRILVHERVAPALNQVTANLAAEQAKGNYYRVRPQNTYGFASRTIAGTYRVSLHGHGNAFDINSSTNPYRADNKLITDMPDWFVKSFTDAGFCWGGEWRDFKDPMHFSWMGPAATPGYGTVPGAYPVQTQAADFSRELLTATTPFGVPDPADRYLLADGNGNGLADVFQLIQKDNGIRLEYSLTHRRYQACSVDRDHALDVDFAGKVALLGDYSGSGRNDLWLIDPSSGRLSIQVALKPTHFRESMTIPTLIEVGSDDSYLLADHNRDGKVDLYVIRRDGSATSLEVYSGADNFATKLVDVDLPLGDTTGWLFTIDDRDLDGLPDLYAIEPTGAATNVNVLANGYTAVTSRFALDVGGDFLDVVVNDFDGDGRGDLWFFDTTGRVTVRAGNTTLTGVGLTTWQNQDSWTCPETAVPYDFDGTFRDDDGNIHESAIEVIAAAGIARGCNPPYNDEYCPEPKVTRGAMAAFLVRALGLSGPAPDAFVDDDSSVFEADINLIARAGITQGCNPPAGDRYCPDDTVDRGELAAFLVRGLGLTDDGGRDWFVDDGATPFEGDINRIAAAGITRGCNPPANDRFCPWDAVGRDEMASFLARAIALLP